MSWVTLSASFLLTGKYLISTYLHVLLMIIYNTINNRSTIILYHLIIQFLNNPIPASCMICSILIPYSFLFTYDSYQAIHLLIYTIMRILTLKIMPVNSINKSSQKVHGDRYQCLRIICRMEHNLICRTTPYPIHLTFSISSAFTQ